MGLPDPKLTKRSAIASLEEPHRLADLEWKLRDAQSSKELEPWEREALLTSVSLSTYSYT